MTVRRATPEDAERASAVLRRSITECCGADHRGNPEVLAAWLRNKTPEHQRQWLSAPENHGVVALIDGEMVGVGLLSGAGRITLCYLIPEARFRGAGKALLRALEDEARRRGLAQIELTSTQTAYAFYLRNGYSDTGRTQPGFGMISPVLSKQL